jgi:hypothetical protein
LHLHPSHTKTCISQNSHLESAAKQPLIAGPSCSDIARKNQINEKEKDHVSLVLSFDSPTGKPGISGAGANGGGERELSNDPVTSAMLRLEAGKVFVQPAGEQGNTTGTPVGNLESNGNQVGVTVENFEKTEKTEKTEKQKSGVAETTGQQRPQNTQLSPNTTPNPSPQQKPTSYNVHIRPTVSGSVSLQKTGTQADPKQSNSATSGGRGKGGAGRGGMTMLLQRRAPAGSPGLSSGVKGKEDEMGEKVQEETSHFNE